MDSHLVSLRKDLPTPFTIALGERIREARTLRGLSQAQLAQRIKRRQAAISDMERGRMEPNATALLMLADVLDKPVSFFFPSPWGPKVSRSDLSYDEQALLLEFRRLRDDDYQKIAIRLVAALAELNAESP